MKRYTKKLVLALVLVAALIAGFLLFYEEEESVSIVSLAQEIRAGQVQEIRIGEEALRIIYVDGSEAKAQKEPESTLLEQLATLQITPAELAEVTIVLAGPSGWARVGAALNNLVAVCFLGGLGYLLYTKVPGFANGSLFGGQGSRVSDDNRPAVTFADVAGVNEAKLELQEVVTFLREPERFAAIGARIPKGILLIGPAGTGKTLLAKAVAGESAVPFFNMSGSEFLEMYVGVGARRVRKLFEEAKKQSPSIIFIDEIDAVGRHRDVGGSSNNGEREQTLNQILVEIDGFDSETGVIVIAATNRPDILDKALIRPGRFDRQITLAAPDIQGRQETFAVHLQGKPVGGDVSPWELARATPGFVGADIENVVNEAAILAVRNGRSLITAADFDAAIERVMAGPEKEGRIISEHERQVVAYHEVGHALVAHRLPGCDPLKKVSLVPRGGAAGYTITLPEQDRLLVSAGKLQDDMAYILGGRAAEELIFGEVTTGASNDLMKATDLARKMVTHYGMSEALGPVSFCRYPDAQGEEPRSYSEAKAMQIDEEIRRLVEEAYARAKEILSAQRESLEALVAALHEQETLSAEEFAQICGAGATRAPAAA